MKAEIKGGKLMISAEMESKVFKSGKKGYFAQAVVAVGGRKLRLNLIAIEHFAARCGVDKAKKTKT